MRARQPAIDASGRVRDGSLLHVAAATQEISMANDNTPGSEVVAFWREAGPDKWFAKDEAFDREFRARFADLHAKAAAGALQDWLKAPYSALALILLLDQYPRNCFRGTTRVYATDPLARDAARAVLAAGFDKQIDRELRVFLYLPFSHSEDIADQEIGLAKGKELGEPYEEHSQGHYDIVKRFGRFPHRNGIFDRESTPEEQKFLDDGGFKG